jgi:hypothetical protein
MYFNVKWQKSQVPLTYKNIKDANTKIDLILNRSIPYNVTCEYFIYYSNNKL